jgi:hypothetical protein
LIQLLIKVQFPTILLKLSQFSIVLNTVSPQTAYGYPLDLPTFEWVDLYALKIVFPDGNVDFAYLKRYNPIPVGPNERAEDVDPCIFNGHLEHEKTVYVTLVGCPFTKNFQVFRIYKTFIN